MLNKPGPQFVSLNCLREIANTQFGSQGDEAAAIVYFDNLTTDPRREPSAEHPSFKTTAKNLTVYA
jgi:hypothetical protein